MKPAVVNTSLGGEVSLTVDNAVRNFLAGYNRDGRLDVSGAFLLQPAGDRAWASVDGAVPHRPRLVVARVRRHEQLAPKAAAKRYRLVRGDADRCAVEGT